MPKNPCKQAALYLLRRFTSSTPRKLMTNSMAGLLTYSGNRGLPNRHNQWLSVFSEPFLEFTAAGLFGIHTDSLFILHPDRGFETNALQR